MGEYKISSLVFSFLPSQKALLLLVKSLGCSRRCKASMWRESLQHRFKHLKTGIAGKRWETHNYSSTPRCGHNNFIVNPLVPLTSFTREVWRARGHSPAAGSLSVIGTVCLITFFFFLHRFLYYLERLLFPLPCSWFPDSEGNTSLVNEVQAFETSWLVHGPVPAHNLVMGTRQRKGDLGRQFLELELESILPWRAILLALDFCF